MPSRVDRTDFASPVTCRRSGSSVARSERQVERVLRVLAEELQARGKLDLDETDYS
jgi:hypothetical protein